MLLDIYYFLILTLYSDEDEDGEEGGGPLGDYDDEDEDDEGSEGGEVGLSYLTKEGIQVRAPVCLIRKSMPYMRLNVNAFCHNILFVPRHHYAHT